MKAVSVRELKNNPSDALRLAQTDVVVVTSRNRPEAVLVHLSEETLLAEAGVRTALAVSLFKEDALPLGRAARLAGMALGDFIRHLSRLGIPAVKGDERSLSEDLDDLDAWLARSA
jgi:prevent-host-death family protein